MHVTIRPASAADYPQVCAILQQVHDLHVDWRPDIYRPCAPALPQEAFLQEIAHGLFFVAEYQGIISGILSCMERQIRSDRQVERRVLFIDTMAVDEARRGQGIGRQLLDFARQFAAVGAYDGLELQVNARNEAARAMYARCGFTEKSINMELL